jgi:hypothetical protein
MKKRPEKIWAFFDTIVVLFHLLKGLRNKFFSPLREPVTITLAPFVIYQIDGGERILRRSAQTHSFQVCVCFLFLLFVPLR